MKGEKKIYKVLKHIKEESKISPDESWVKFKCNTSIVGPGILSAREEKNILIKLQNMEVIKLHLPSPVSDRERGIVSSYTPEEFLQENNVVWVELLNNFNSKYYEYKKISKQKDWWKLTNPFYWIKKIIEIIKNLLKFLWSYKLYLVIYVISATLTLLAINYSVVWQNIKNIWNYVNKIFI